MSNPEDKRTESETDYSAETANRFIPEGEDIQEDISNRLAVMAKDLPTYGNSAFITNLLKIVREFMENPDEDVSTNKVEGIIDGQLGKLSDLIENYNNMDIPAGAEEIYNNVMDSLDINYDALLQFREMIINMDTANIKQGLSILMEADYSLKDIENRLRMQAEEMVITTIL